MDIAEGSALSAGKDAASRAATERKTDSGRAASRASPARESAGRARRPDAWSREALSGGHLGRLALEERVCLGLEDSYLDSVGIKSDIAELAFYGIVVAEGDIVKHCPHMYVCMYYVCERPWPLTCGVGPHIPQAGTVHKEFSLRPHLRGHIRALDASRAGPYPCLSGEGRIANSLKRLLPCTGSWSESSPGPVYLRWTANRRSARDSREGREPIVC